MYQFVVIIPENNLSPIETSPSLVRIGEKGRKFEFIAVVDVLLISRAGAKRTRHDPIPGVGARRLLVPKVPEKTSLIRHVIFALS